MGISYTPRTITGIRLDYIQQPELAKFLAEHGYPLTEDQYEQIQDDGWEVFGEFFEDVRFEIEGMDGWSGHGWTIGINSKDPESLEIMKAAFPNAKVEVFDYVQVG